MTPQVGQTISANDFAKINGNGQNTASPQVGQTVSADDFAKMNGEQKQSPGLLSRLGNRIGEFGKGISQTIRDIPEDVKAITDPLGGHHEKIGQDLLHTAAQPFGAAADIAGSAIGGLFHGGLKVLGVDDDFNRGVDRIKNLAPVRAISGKANDFAKQNPDVAQAFQDAGDVAAGTGVITSAATLYGNAKNALTNHRLISDLTKSGVENPDDVASALADERVAPGQATYKQAITHFKNRLAQAQDLVDNLSQGEAQKEISEGVPQALANNPEFQSAPLGLNAATEDISRFKNILNVLTENGQDIYGPVFKSGGLLRKAIGLTGAGGLLGVGANVVPKVGGYLKDKFLTTR